MQVTVQLSKQEEGYCVVSMPSDVEYEPKIGFLATADFASPPTSAAAMALQPKPGESITAKVIAMPGPETSNRLMLIPVNLFALEGEQGNKGKEKQMSSTKPKMRKTRFPPAGTITTVVVSAVHPLSMEVSLAEPPQLGGRIHVTEMAHDQKDTSPTKGSSLQAVVLGKTVGPSEESPFLVELSTRPEVS